VGNRRRPDRVDGDLHVTVGAVLEPHRHRQARAELAVDLTLGRARADRAPRHQVGDVLRGDRVEELATDRQSQVEDLAQQLARQAQAGVDVAGAIEVGIVDQPLPADRGPRLLEVDPHRNQQVVAQLLGPSAQALSVLERRVHVVDAARSHHHHQPVVLAVEDAGDLAAPGEHEFLLLGAEREVVEQLPRRDQGHDPPDAAIADPFRSPCRVLHFHFHPKCLSF
jgi:hypothetical protein